MGSLDTSKISTGRIIAADITSEHTVDAVNEITKLQNEVPGADGLGGIQRYMAGIFVLQNSTPTGIINQLNFLDLYGLDDSYLTNRVKNIMPLRHSRLLTWLKNIC